MADVLSVPQGRFNLRRLPLRRRELLRAYDASDEYLLNYLSEAQLPSIGARVLIVNDSFGALTVALHGFKPSALSDSYLSQQATLMNFSENALSIDGVRLMTSLELPVQKYDLIVIKAPKTLALLEYQLISLRPFMTSATRIITAGMVKNLSANVWRLLETIVGTTSTAQAWKKSRLIFSEPDDNISLPVNPYPLSYRLEGTNYTIVNHANVFSRDSLDIGTRFFIEHIGCFPNAETIIDLGCGNGIVGLLAAERNPNAVVHFVDESFMAIASARENFKLAFGESRLANFSVGDCLSDFTAESADVILCNPPFHQQNAVGDMIAAKMFRQAREVIKRGGKLLVIGNRHLGYHLELKKLFGNVSVIAANRKFVILQSMVE
ncbi:methyltransferase [Methylotuvimicrobium buryatense]|uniref:Ribosomal RNA large subunit methyltransferase G n=1 Tax=Methylotuvimicrobium buryatense TaxID=95641 RepID=A0A4P9UPS8_METBY|nr:methyltransferase [Methylotuvimicrobium buryatense]QCW82241.1 methyltransferase domain-containing protein [Methylotuvimicrobium buryatense]